MIKNDKTNEINNVNKVTDFIIKWEKSTLKWLVKPTDFIMKILKEIIYNIKLTTSSIIVLFILFSSLFFINGRKSS